MLSRAVLVPLSYPKRLYLFLNNEQQLSTKLAEYRVVVARISHYF